MLKDAKKIILKPAIEKVEREKVEYLLLGKFRLKQGMKLFSYNSKTFKVKEEFPEFKEIPKIVFLGEDNYELIGETEFKLNTDSRFEYFQALNPKTALKRVARFKAGKLKYLGNLRDVKSFERLPPIY